MFVPPNKNCKIIDFRIYKVISIETEEEIPTKEVLNVVVNSEGILKIKNFENLLEPSHIYV